MAQSRSLWEQLKRIRLTALLAPRSVDECLRAYDIFQPLGVVLEVALRTDAAIEGIAELRRRHPDALLLAGTVTSADQAQRVIEAGAAGVVCPDYYPPVVDTCVAADVMCIPGGLADAGKQLARKAELYGCTLDELRTRHPYQWVYKLFPAVAGGGVFLDLPKAWRAVFPSLTIVYTGGISAENIRPIVEQDPDAIICGSALTRDIDDAERTRSEAERWLAEIRGQRHEKTIHPQTSAGRPPAAEAPTVVTFGEIMLRLSPPEKRRFTQAAGFEATFGGAEANVAVSLAQWGLHSRYVSAVPAHGVGQAAVNVLRGFAVDTTHILRQGTRLGVNYLEHGASQRPSRVIYDRAGSAVSELRPGQVDWDAVFEGADWFHWTGITPALSESAAATVAEAVAAAKRAGATVSVDLNYRWKLWPARRARDVMTPLMEHVDIAIGNEEDAAQVFGLRAGDSDVSAGRLDVAAYQDVAARLIERFNLRLVATTLRQSVSASDNRWSACLHDGSTFHKSREYAIHIVDRVGGGDAFAAGLIYGLIGGRGAAEALEFAVAAGCLKHTVQGDFGLATATEIEALVAGDASGRVRR